MAAWFKASRAMLLSVALGVLVGLLVPGVDSLGRSLRGNDAEQTTEAGAIGVLEAPATPEADEGAEETDAPPTQRPRTNSGTATHSTPAPTDDGTVVIIATPHPDDDSHVDEGDSHSSGSSSSSSEDDHHDNTPEPEPEPEATDEHANEDPHSVDETCCN